MTPGAGAPADGRPGPAGAKGEPRVLCVAGDAGSGKTGLLRRLLPRLGLPPERVGVVKHTHHAIDWHPAGKDSALLWDAGPGALCVAGPDQTALFLRADPGRGGARGPEGGPAGGGAGDDADEAAAQATRRLAEACRRLPAGTRLVLAEGFRRARAPKIWTAAGPPGSDPLPPGVRAVVVPADRTPAWHEVHPELEVLARDEAAGLAARVAGWAAPVSELTPG